jgi:hypothetical protein
MLHLLADACDSESPGESVAWFCAVVMIPALAGAITWALCRITQPWADEDSDDD